MRVSFVCTYCDHKWEKHIYSAADNEKCPKCSDKNVKYKETSTNKIDYYEGTSEFEEKTIDINTNIDWENMSQD